MPYFQQQRLSLKLTNHLLVLLQAIFYSHVFLMTLAQNQKFVNNKLNENNNNFLTKQVRPSDPKAQLQLYPQLTLFAILVLRILYGSRFDTYIHPSIRRS